MTKREERSRTLIKENIAKNLPSLGWDLDIQIHKINRLPHFSMQNDLLKDIIMTLTENKNKEKIQKQHEKKQF